MDFEIRKMTMADFGEVFSMMKEFYNSDAVYTNGSDGIFKTNIEICAIENPYLEGFVFSAQGNILGYAMIAKSFSTEFGKPCIWFEDLYLKQDFRGHGIISKFVNFIQEKYPNHIYRLEVEKENEHACHVYKKLGFEPLPYLEMKQ